MKLNYYYSDPTNMTCRICNNIIGNQTYIVKEMMFGFRDEFTYFQCNSCNCLQIETIPENISKYYPDHYYSFKNDLKFVKTRQYRIHRTINELFHFDLLGWLFKLYKPFPPKLNILKNLNLNLDSKILDVGCGNGVLLKTMYNEGFSDLTGVDPYIDKDITYNQFLKLLKCDIFNVSDTYDLIMLNHSLEHMAEQQAVFKKIYTLLRPGATLLIRIPIVSSYSWERFGVNWVELDAPRHFFLHSLESINKLAEDSGFEIYKTIHDSISFEILGSIQYEQDIPLRSEISYSENLENSIFTNEDIEKYESLVKSLNKEGRGGRACFYLRKRSNV